MKYYKTETITGQISEKRRYFLSALICLYLFFYSILSWHGGYIFYNQGGADNQEAWFPAYCAEPYTLIRPKVRYTALGWIFLPPMLIDQTFIHPTRYM